MFKSNSVITKKAYSDKILAQVYTDYNRVNTRGRQQLKCFLQQLPSGGKVLDLGCGPGWYSGEIAKLGFFVTGLDYSAEMIAMARKNNLKFPNCEWVEADMMDLSKVLTGNSFDGVWARASLLHISKDNIDKVLEGIVKVCANEALVMISLKEGEGEVRIKDTKFELETEREFVLWQREEFESEAVRHGYNLVSYDCFNSSSKILGRLTKRHWFVFKINK